MQRQSYIFTTMHGTQSLYENRIIIKIVEACQNYINKRYEMITRGYDGTQVQLPDNERIEIRSRDIMPDQSRHYELIKEAAISLQRKLYEYWDTDRKTWGNTALIYNVRYNTGTGTLSFYIAKKTLETIIDFTKGFSTYSMETAIEMPTANAARLYILMAGQRKAVTFPLESLKSMYGVTDKYDRSSDFIKRVIAPAADAINQSGKIGITYRPCKTGNKITGITFGTTLPKAQHEEATRGNNLTGTPVFKAISITLIGDARFTYQETRNNQGTINNFCMLPEPLTRLKHIIFRSQGKDRPKAYIMGAMKSEVTAWKRLLITT